MMGHREPQKGGAEYDAFSRRARKFLSFRAGAKAMAKRAFSRRVRRTVKLCLRREA